MALYPDSLYDFPNVSAYDSDLREVLAMLRGLVNKMRDYEVVNKITNAGAWDITKQYKPWTIVSDNNIGYISVRPVPAGIEITNTDYWALVADYDILITNLSERISALENTVGDNTSGLVKEVNDINAQLNPAIEIRGQIETVGTLNAHMFIDACGFMYVCNYNENKISIYDTSDNEEPLFVGSFPTAANPRDCVRVGNYLMVACFGAGVVNFYDISNPGVVYSTLAPALTLSVTDPKAITLVGNNAFVACTNKVVKITISDVNPISATITGSQNLSYDVLKVAYNGFNCYAAVGQSNIITVFPENMARSWTVNTGGGNNAFATFKGGKYLYVTDHTGGKLHVINAANITMPALVTSIDLGLSAPEELTIIGNLLYAVDLTDQNTLSKLVIVDISEPELPRVVQTIDLTIPGAGFIAAIEDYLYIDSHWSNKIESVFINNKAKIY